MVGDKKKEIPKSVWMVLVFLPLIIAGLYVTLINIHYQFRYDDKYFSDNYLEMYDSPGSIAMGVEKAVQTGDAALFQELSGLRRSIPVKSSPDTIFTILLDVDDRGYFHYLYLDMGNYHRKVYYVKQVRERWVVVPEDFYYYWDSGRWWDVYLPLALVWWVILAVVIVAVFVYRLGGKYREAMHR